MTFTINTQSFTIPAPQNINFTYFPASNFLEYIYTNCYNLLINNNNLYQLDFDYVRIHTIIQTAINRQNPRTLITKLNGEIINLTTWTSNPLNKAMLLFFSIFPDFNLLFKNINTDVEISILNAEILCGQCTNTANFVFVKSKLDEINRNKWSRAQNQSEKQAGVKLLGNTSEKLLEIAMARLIDEKNFFRSQNQDVQSYGDFVAMCLPNNLWISVKSSFARERLLASGYTTDIIGVGFFTSFREFTSRTKIRNFNKVGFLAMYIPDLPLSEEQVQSNISTYEEILNYYNQNNISLPLNINGTNFLRPSSQLYSDLRNLLSIQDMKNRTTLRY